MGDEAATPPNPESRAPHTTPASAEERPGGEHNPSLNRYARLIAELAIDAAIILLCYYTGFLLRFDGQVPRESLDTFWMVAPLIVAGYLLANWAMGVYRTAWEYGGISDVLNVGKAVLLVTVIITAFNRTRAERDIPLSVNLIAGALVFLLMAFWKMSPRLLKHRPSRNMHATAKRLLIVGAGNTGQLVAREFRQHRDWDYRPVCFADDDPAKRGKHIHGVPVAGTTSDIPDLVDRFRIDVVALALPSAPRSKVRDLLAVCQVTGVPVRMVPGLPELVQDPHLASQLREVTVEDLLGRDPVDIDYSQCLESLHNKVVLITGAAGSIGSELARQVVTFKPAGLHLLDNNETGLHDLRQELLKAGAEVDVRLWPGDIRDAARMRRIFDAVRPRIVFHAAAYKHVGMMEDHPDEAFRANVLGTRIICRATAEAGAEKLVFITTDKAVNPTSVYGATKRIGELLVLANAERSATVFCAVRFGNVIGSRGSVVPIFARQISEGGPVGVTHPDATRYFLTIPEAVSLVIQAAAFAEQGQVFMLDMGEEVSIQELAEKMIRLKGLEPGKDVPIVYTGLRPGEKVREELFAAHEQQRPTHHPKVMLMYGGGHVTIPDLDAAIDALAAHPPVEREEFVRALHRLARLGPGDAQSMQHAQRRPGDAPGADLSR